MTLPTPITAGDSGHVAHHTEIHAALATVAAPYVITGISSSTYATRPAAGNVGHVHLATDRLIWSVDNGTDWVETPANGSDLDVTMPGDWAFTSGRPWFDVLGFGADPTGTVDSQPAIQAALDAARDAGGGTVYLPAGTYLVDYVEYPDPDGSDGFGICLLAYNSTTILGAGSGGTTIRALDTFQSGDGIRLIQGGNHPYEVGGHPSDPALAFTYDVTIQDVTLDGTFTAFPGHSPILVAAYGAIRWSLRGVTMRRGAGVTGVGAEQLRIEDCTFRDMPASAVSFIGITGESAVGCADAVVSGCHFNSVAGAAVYLLGDNANLVIDGNGSQGLGTFIYRGGTGTLYRSVISNNVIRGGSGTFEQIYLDGVQNTVVGNVIAENTSTGAAVKLVGSGEAVIASNHVQVPSATVTAIETQVIDTTVVGNECRGVIVVGQRSTVQGNKCDGITIQTGAANTSVTGNRVVGQITGSNVVDVTVGSNIVNASSGSNAISSTGTSNRWAVVGNNCRIGSVKSIGLTGNDNTVVGNITSAVSAGVSQIFANAIA